MAGPTVAYLINDLRLGGATRQLAVLTRALGRRAHPVVFCLSRHDEPLAPQLREAGVCVHTFRRPIRWDPFFVAALVRRLRAERVDLLHGWLDAANAYAWLAARPLRVPVVFGIQSDRLQLPGLRGHVFAGMLRRANAVTVNSRAGYDFLVDRVRVPRERVLLVPNWIGVETSLATATGPTPVIAFAGRLVPVKRVDVLIDAFASLRGRGVKARLEIAGDGPEMESLRRRARRSGFDDDIVFHGMVEDVRPLLERCSCVVIPSEFEGLPNTAVEAFAAGVPVVANPVGDLPDLVRDGRTGRLVAGETASDLARAIASVLGDAALRQAAREAGPALVRERFSVEGAIDALSALYGRLLSGTTSGPGARG